MCDGVSHCPLHDDEILCDLDCPITCQCQGHAFRCTENFNVNAYIHLRFLNASFSNLTLSNISGIHYLIQLHMSHCYLPSIPKLDFPNLLLADFSWSSIFNLDMSSFNQLGQLRSLILTGNPLLFITDSFPQQSIARNLNFLDLSFTGIAYYEADDFASFVNLAHLDLNFSNVSEIGNQGFKTSPRLEKLNIGNTPLESFPTNLLKNLNKLKTVYSSNHRLCCERILPHKFDSSNCHSVRDVLSSCEDLLRSDLYRLCLWFVALLAILGTVSMPVTFK